MKTATTAGLGAAGVIAAGTVIALLPAAGTADGVKRVKFTTDSAYLVLEFLDDDLLHFEVSGVGGGPSERTPIPITPQVSKSDYAGPHSFARDGTTMETDELSVTVNETNLCMTLRDKARNVPLTTLCPEHLGGQSQRLSLTQGAVQDVYGLGEQFGDPGQSDGSWMGRRRTPGDGFGNQMTGYEGGATGNAQVPIMYAVGPDGESYALFLDHIYKQTWAFTDDPWTIDTGGDAVRGYVLTGADLPDLRQDYMELVGRPPVPPKQAFGLWVSEYGFDDWAELDSKLDGLRDHGFPLDGFVLDLQWFGGVTAGSDDSNMGRVDWDSPRFPDPKAKLATYKARDGLGFITIEESYVSRGRPEHQDLENRGYLVRQCADCAPVYLTGNPWWGKGGMIDWTLNEGADYWHDSKRQPLVEAGVFGHWIDLGEPEQYNGNDWVAGVLPGKHEHADYHNAYTLKWAESIARGYQRHNTKRRPFIMARSGAAGIQRFGTALWSGDIGGNLRSLAAQFNVQMHMSFSGIDYFGSDIGGFHRQNAGSEVDDLYTQWFASSMWTDVPVRPHTNNVCGDRGRGCKETAPDRVGDLASNLANARQRYELIPYYYSLAHRAHLYGEPVVPPLVYYYPKDLTARQLGAEKLIGRDILVACVARPGATSQDVYLPAGDWIDYHTNEWVESRGETLSARPLYVDGLFRVPAYVRRGAILPKMAVDEKTGNALGKRTDGSTRNELIVRVYTGTQSTSFELFEDDGETIEYAAGQLRKTVISQEPAGSSVAVKIAAAEGSYAGAPTQRNNIIELVTNGQPAAAVKLNGTPVQEAESRAAFEAASGASWYDTGNGLVLARSGGKSVTGEKDFAFELELQKPAVFAQFVCDEGTTVPGQSVYVVGNTPQLGNWRAQEGVKLAPQAYPRWTGKISGLPRNSSVEWKCIKRAETGDTSTVVMWEPGQNNVLVTPESGSAGTTVGAFTDDDDEVSTLFVCDAGFTVPGQSVYVVGSVPRLGNWQAHDAVKLEPDGPYPRWTGAIDSLPPSTEIQWKCIKRAETGDTDTVVMWEPGSNNLLTTPASGEGETTAGSF